MPCDGSGSETIVTVTVPPSGSTGSGKSSGAGVSSGVETETDCATGRPLTGTRSTVATAMLDVSVPSKALTENETWSGTRMSPAWAYSKLRSAASSATDGTAPAPLTVIAFAPS